MCRTTFFVETGGLNNDILTSSVLLEIPTHFSKVTVDVKKRETFRDF